MAARSQDSAASQSPSGSAVPLSAGPSLISAPLQAHESPCTTFPLYYNTSTLGIKREKLSKLLVVLKPVKRIQPKQGKAFTTGSHSEVIPSHGENYVGHQKVFHCCPAGAAVAHRAREKGREQPKSPRLQMQSLQRDQFQVHLS